MAAVSVDRYPTGYALAARARLVARYGSPLGAVVARGTRGLFPGAPVSALLGFTGGAVHPYEDTVCYGAADPGAVCMRQGFHEVGYYQVPAGPRDGPAPHPDPDAPHNAWTRLAGGATVYALLGRAAVTAPDAWRAAEVDQGAVGVANIRSDGQAVGRALAALGAGDLAAQDWGSPWAVATAFMGFSAGPQGAALWIARYAPALRGVAERDRWGAFVRAVAADAARGAFAGAGASHGANPAYTTLRTLQKLESGRQLAAVVGEDAHWFDLGPDHDALLAAVTQGAYGGTAAAVQAASAAPPPSGIAGTGPGGGLGVAVGLGALAGAAYLLWRALRA